MTTLKDNLENKLKSSKRFGDLFVQKNWQELLKERRFLFFTKRGPIEIVFNIKHYISAFLLSLLISFKVIQFIFFSTLNIYTALVLHGNLTQKQQFTESEVEALKDLAGTVIDSKTNEKISSIEIDSIETEKVGFNDKLKDSFKKVGLYFKSFEFSIVDETKLSDGFVFDQFSGLANPHMVPIEETLKKSNSSKFEIEKKK